MTDIDTFGKLPYRLACTMTFISTLLLCWIAAGVGLLGRDGDPANLVYGLVVIIAVAGAVLSKRQARGMTITLLGMALTMLFIAGIAISAGLQYAFHNSVLEILLLNLFFAVLYCGCAALFWQASRTGKARSQAR